MMRFLCRLFLPLASVVLLCAALFAARAPSSAASPIGGALPMATTCSTGFPRTCNWSGYMLHDTNASAPLDDAKGTWNVQCTTAGDPSAEVATWVGIGGHYGTQELAQAGVGIYNGAFRPFVEFAPDGPIYIANNIALGCTTTVTAEVWYSSGDAAWCGNVVWAGGAYFNCGPTSFVPDQTSAEWVDERPSCGLGYYYLTNFHYTNFSNGYAHTASQGWHTIAYWTTYALSMYDFNGAQLAYAHGLSLSQPTSFQDTFVAAGDGHVCKTM